MSCRKAPLEAWIDEVKHADWKDAHDIKAEYRSASPVGNRRVVFNIKGNDYQALANATASMRS